METSLYCSTAAATPVAAASGSQKKGKKHPDNETRKTRSEAWLQRRTVSRPALVSTAVTAASALEEIGQAVWTVPVMAAATPPGVLGMGES